MSQKKITIIIALVALLQSIQANYNIQPLYQVSLMKEFQPGNPTHICNGAIIYEKLIITTASCVHFKFGSNGKLNKLDPSILSVVAGSTNAFMDALRMNVTFIEIAKDFDSKTLENDLALLTLSKPLPLGTRPDMSWIMLDDNVHTNHSCLANFFSRNSKDAIPNFYQTEELTTSNSEICRNETEYPESRKEDICSIYVLPQQFDCAAAETFLSFNNDRGTGLVCKSFLVGLLSSVVTRPDPKNNCSDVTLKAMFTNIFPHLSWVYNIMAAMETEFISTPYDASLKSLVTNATQDGDKEVLTSTILPSNNISTSVNSTTNSTGFNPNLSNSTTWSHPNLTAINSTTISPLSVNSTATWNSTIVSNSTTVRQSPTSPSYTTSSPTPTIGNVLQSNAAAVLVQFSTGSFLIACVSLRLII